jgi:hypothetical protein
MPTWKLTLNAVRITVNSAFVIGTDMRSFVFCTLFITAENKICHVSLEKKSFSNNRKRKILAE